MPAQSIGIFTYSTKPRGSVVHSACLAEALHELGHDVTLYALDKDGEGFFRALRCPFVPMPAAAAPKELDALIAQRIDEVARHLVHVRPNHQVLHAEDCLVASALVSVRASLPRAVLCRTVHHVERFESMYLEQCQRRSIEQADLVLSVSRATQRDVLARYGTPSAVIENGVDFARFSARSGAAELTLRERVGVAPEAPLVVAVGGVEARKNTLGMLAGFAQLRVRLPAARFLIAGGASIFEHSEYQRTFDRALAQLPAETQRAVMRVGVLRENEMPALYGTADVLLHAAKHEGFGLCVLEAMAAGTQVVVSRGEPFDEFLDDSCSLRVDPHHPGEIADALFSCLTAPSPSRIESGRARASRYSWIHSAERHAQSYRTAQEEI